MKIQESAENYLETILILSHRIGQVRSIDIVNEMNFSKPSISYAMKQLRENGYISMDESGYITLTDKGMEIAERIYERHKVLTDYLISLGVDEDIAKGDACRIEHVISPMSFEMIKKAYKEMQKENKE
ncbi:MAG TPA: metal-dependent transcriptional regulator [Acetivibrio sp.]|uniref:metal-dependent transcriptional regulator n=1 Tax=Acetivibrio sp. TaxID=1872092 RepID=UPI002C006BFF|nr:metal-dependent transcriptional regulator [Acetivibrio sp.]HOM03355.1 metal-dependent transcriptional regulator [Acetivibrio sp.]